MDDSSAGFSRGQKLLIGLCLVWILGCYGSMCGLTMFVWAGGDPVAVILTLTPAATETRFVTPLPTYTPYPTSTQTAVPTKTPLFPDYFFPTATSEPTLTPSPEDTATITPMPTDTPLPVASAIPSPVNTPTLAPTASLHTGCTCEADTLNCGNFADQAGAQQCFAFCQQKGSADIYGLDGDNNGLACDGYDGPWNN